MELEKLMPMESNIPRNIKLSLSKHKNFHRNLQFPGDSHISNVHLNWMTFNFLEMIDDNVSEYLVYSNIIKVGFSMGILSCMVH